MVLHANDAWGAELRLVNVQDGVRSLTVEFRQAFQDAKATCIDVLRSAIMINLDEYATCIHSMLSHPAVEGLTPFRVVDAMLTPASGDTGPGYTFPLGLMSVDRMSFEDVQQPSHPQLPPMRDV